MNSEGDLYDESNKHYHDHQRFNKILLHIPLLSSASATDGGNSYLQGDLIFPSPILNLKSLIIFAVGSESINGRANTRNRHIANILNKNGSATLLIDLLTPKEQESDIRGQKTIRKHSGVVLNYFNMPLLSDRLSAITSGP